MTLLTFNDCCNFVHQVFTGTDKLCQVSTKQVRNFHYIQLTIDQQVWTIGAVKTANAVLKQVI